MLALAGLALSVAALAVLVVVALGGIAMIVVGIVLLSRQSTAQPTYSAALGPAQPGDEAEDQPLWVSAELGTQTPAAVSASTGPQRRTNRGQAIAFILVGFVLVVCGVVGAILIWPFP